MTDIKQNKTKNNNTAKEMKNAFDEVINSLDMAEERDLYPQRA